MVQVVHLGASDKVILLWGGREAGLLNVSGKKTGYALKSIACFFYVGWEELSSSSICPVVLRTYSFFVEGHNIRKVFLQILNTCCIGRMGA